MQTDFLNTKEKIQRINNYASCTKPVYIKVALVIALSIATIGSIGRCNPQPAKTDAQCTTCHNRQTAMTSYFKKSGNKTPEEMALAVLATKSPRLLAAMATKGELNTPYTVRKGGWKKQHAGAWQVNKKYWGSVPLDPVGQALKTEDILEDLTRDMPIEKALSLYGGDSTPKYANRIIAELENVP